jgi:hypothetical protein
MSDITPSDKARADRLARSMQSLTDDAMRPIERFIAAMQPQPELAALLWELLARKALAKIKEIRN